MTGTYLAVLRPGSAVFILQLHALAEYVLFLEKLPDHQVVVSETDKQ